MLARGAPEAILPPLIIGVAVVFGATFAHVSIGQAMTPLGADLILYLLATPGALLILSSIFLLSFYRDPARTPARGVVSAADGRVILVEPVDDEDVGDGQRICVFMSPLNVHVNRLPASATLLSTSHHPGGYLPAFRKESEQNERLVSLWRTHGDDGGMKPDEPLKVIQIAGAMAKRIVPWVEDGATVRKGERFGMIKLGSRVDVYLPPGYESAVRVGDRVRAGATTLAVPVGPAR